MEGKLRYRFLFQCRVRGLLTSLGRVQRVVRIVHLVQLPTRRCSEEYQLTWTYCSKQRGSIDCDAGVNHRLEMNDHITHSHG